MTTPTNIDSKIIEYARVHQAIHKLLTEMGYDTAKTGVEPMLLAAAMGFIIAHVHPTIRERAFEDIRRTATDVAEKLNAMYGYPPRTSNLFKQ